METVRLEPLGVARAICDPVEHHHTSGVTPSLAPYQARVAAWHVAGIEVRNDGEHASGPEDGDGSIDVTGGNLAVSAESYDHELGECARTPAFFKQ